MTGYPRPYRLTYVKHDGAIAYQWKHGVDGRKQARGTYRELRDSDQIKTVRLYRLTDEGWEQVKP